MIVIVQNSLKTTYLFRKSYIEYLAEIGERVTVIAFDDSELYKGKLESLGAVVIPIDMKLNILFRVMLLNWSIIKACFNQKKTILQCHFISSIILAYPSLFFYSRRTTVIIEGIGSALMNRSALLIFIKKLLTMPKFNRIFMNSDERRLLGLPTDKVLGGIGILLEPMLNKKVFNPSSVGPFRIIYAGRLVEDKGILDCFDVLSDLLQRGVNVTLEVCGETYPANPSSLSDNQIDTIKTMFGNKVVFSGFVDNLNSRLQSADILILPSKLEGFPVVVMEASNVGTPSIVYDVPGCRDAVLNGVNGYVVPYGNKLAMSSKILEIFSLDNLSRKKLSDSCREHALSHFDINLKNVEMFEVVSSSM